jgi:hypothetical protein
MTENYINNNFNLTLATAVNNTNTTLIVSSAVTVDGGFRILIESELLSVTSGGLTTSWTVVRGIEGTTANSHSAGGPINIVMTAGGLANILAQQSGRVLFTPPPSSGWSWVNQGSATISTTNSSMYLSCAPDAADSQKLYVRTAPSVPYSVDFGFFPFMFFANYPSCGVGFRESTSGKLYLFGPQSNGLGTGLVYLQRSYYTNETTFSSDSGGTYGNPWALIPMFYRLSVDSTNYTVYQSNDGINYLQFFQESKTAFMSSGPDQIFIYVNPRNTTFGCGLKLVHYYEH